MSQMMMDDERFEEISQVAAALDMSAEQYLLHLHKKNRSLKDVLLTENNDFKDFIQDYQSLVDRLFYYQNQMMEEMPTKENHELIESVSELLKLTVTDSFILAQIYEAFSKNKTNPLFPVRVPEA